MSSKVNNENLEEIVKEEVMSDSFGILSNIEEIDKVNNLFILNNINIISYFSPKVNEFFTLRSKINSQKSILVRYHADTSELKIVEGNYDD